MVPPENIESSLVIYKIVSLHNRKEVCAVKNGRIGSLAYIPRYVGNTKLMSKVRIGRVSFEIKET